MFNFIKTLWNNKLKVIICIISLAYTIFTFIYKRDNIVFLIIGISQAAVVFLLNIFIIGKISFNNFFCCKKNVKVIENGKNYLYSLQKEIKTLKALEEKNDNESKLILNSIRSNYEIRKKLLEKKDN